MAAGAGGSADVNDNFKMIRVVDRPHGERWVGCMLQTSQMQVRRLPSAGPPNLQHSNHVLGKDRYRLSCCVDHRLNLFGVDRALNVYCLELRLARVCFPH